MLDAFTIIACAVIIAAFVAAWMFVEKCKEEDLPHKRKWIEQLPSLISTLGVLGTFVGITKGLVSFDTATLDTSIPLLLDGLKTAFFTSLIGMAGAMVLNRVVSRRFDKEHKSTELEKAARMIVDAMRENQKLLPQIIDNANKHLMTILAEDPKMSSLCQDVEQLKDDLEELKGLAQEMKETMDSLAEGTTKLSDEVSQLRALALTATESIATMDNNTGEIAEALSSKMNGDAKE